MSAVHPRPALRSRLDEGRQVYDLALGVADCLDDAGMDLWAAGVRACLDAPDTTSRQQHLAVELVRLSRTSTIRREGLSAPIASALAQLELGLGSVDVVDQPLYDAMRTLTEHLELHGGRRWLARLRMVVRDPGRDARARLDRVAGVLHRMVPGAAGLPPGASPLVEAVAERLPRHRDADRVMTHLGFAVQPPQPSRRMTDLVDGADRLT